MAPFWVLGVFPDTDGKGDEDAVEDAVAEQLDAEPDHDNVAFVVDLMCAFVGRLGIGSQRGADGLDHHRDKIDGHKAWQQPLRSQRLDVLCAICPCKLGQDAEVGRGKKGGRKDEKDLLRNVWVDRVRVVMAIQTAKAIRAQRREKSVLRTTSGHTV